MDVVHTIAKVREHVSKAKSEGKKVGFVPTMGFLHRGHMSLVETSRAHTQYQVMSIFVNKIQFNDPKDFDTYPKDLERDMELAESAGVDLLFIPDDSEMYRDRLTHVDVETLTENLCGAHRPGHFRGVFTVVSKLFNIVLPDISVFGQKDIQQAVSIEKMVTDLDFPLKIIIAPTVREDDGLAMSSRNKRLDPLQRKNALVIYRGLMTAEGLLAGGERDWNTIRQAMEKTILEGGPDTIDYISAARYRDLSLTGTITEKSVIAVAAFFGPTRLIDNMIIEISDEKTKCIF